MADNNAKYYSNRRAEIQKKRELRKEQIRLGCEDNRRLWFITAILRNKGIKQHEVATGLGMTPQNLSYITTVQDDCYLSTVQDILNFAGVSCRVSFDLGKYGQKATPVKNQIYCFRGNVQLEKEPLCPRFISACPSGARLRFLADLIVASGMPFSEFLKKVNMYYSTLQNYFENDNIKISILCNIAECMGTKIVWELNE